MSAINKSWGKIIDGTLTYAPRDLIYEGMQYSPAPNDIYLALGWKLVIPSVRPVEDPREGYKWVKTPDQDDTTIFYRWTEEKLTDAEYVMECHTKLNDSDWATTAYVEGALSEDDWNEWKSKRKVWRDFIREHEQ